MKYIRDMSEQDFSNAIEKIYPGVLTKYYKALIYLYFRDYENCRDDALEFDLIMQGGCDALLKFADYAVAYFRDRWAAHDKLENCLGRSRRQRGGIAVLPIRGCRDFLKGGIL